MLDCAHNQLSPNQRGISISTIIKTSTTVIILFISLAFASNAYAYNCSAVPQYIEGSSYSSSNIVQNEGNAYQCSIGDWCTTGGPYAPPTGWAWPNAWNDLGACDGGSSSSGGSSSGGSSSGRQLRRFIFWWLIFRRIFIRWQQFRWIFFWWRIMRQPPYMGTIRHLQ